MALVAPPSNDKRRVKVYELRNNDWFDRGTGFCSGQMLNVSATRSPAMRKQNLEGKKPVTLSPGQEKTWIA